MTTWLAVWVFVSLAWAAFALGLVCGVVFTSRKDASDDDSYEKAKDEWHDVAT